MKKIIIGIFVLAMLLLYVTGCRSRHLPDDFQISFQFGTKDSDTVTIDTYNKVITLGTDVQTMERIALNLEENMMAEIYYELMDNELNAWEKGDYKGNIRSEQPNVKFSVKFTLNGRTKIISGDGSTPSYAKSEGKDPKKLIIFRDYMIELIKGMDGYKQLTE